MASLGDLFRVQVDPPTVREFCKRISVPDGPHQGMRYDPDVEAPQKIVVDVLDGVLSDYNGEPFRDVSLAWCTQVGKSLIGVLVPSLHAAIGCSHPVVYCLPTADLLGKVWTSKLKPSIEGAGFAEWIPEKGPGSRGGRPTALPFADPATGRRAGSIIFVAGGSGKKREAGQAGVTAAVVLIDEADEYEDAHRVALIQQRAASYGRDAVFVKASTVKKDENSVIVHMVEAGTGSRIWYACPHCGRHQPLEWSQVKYEGGDEAEVRDSARYLCKHCNTGWTERERRAALCDWRLVHRGQDVDADGVVVGPMPRTSAFGLLCNKLDFGIGLGMPDLAVEHFRAKKLIELRSDHGMMRSFYRDRLSLPYHNDELGERLTNKALEARADTSPVFKREVPGWAEYMTAAIDVQGDRCYWQVMAYGGNRWAIVDYGYEFFADVKSEATKEQKHAAFYKVHEKCVEGWPVRNADRNMSPARTGIDSGYDEDTVASWCRSSGWEMLKGAARKQLRQMGTRSVDGKQKSIMSLRGWCDIRRAEAGHRIWHVDADNAKRQVQAGLMMAEDGPGRGYLPNGEPSNGALLLHLSAEVWEFDDDKGQWYWRQVRKRNDYLDLATYNLAMAKVEEYRRERARNMQTRQYGTIGDVT